MFGVGITQGLFLVSVFPALSGSAEYWQNESDWTRRFRDLCLFVTPLASSFTCLLGDRNDEIVVHLILYIYETAGVHVLRSHEYKGKFEGAKLSLWHLHATGHPLAQVFCLHFSRALN